MKTYVVTHTQKDPSQSYGLVAEGLKLVAAEFSKIDKNLWLVRSAASSVRTVCRHSIRNFSACERCNPEKIKK